VLALGSGAAAGSAAADVVVVGVGDMTCNTVMPSATTCHQQAISDLALGLAPTKLLALGDEQYDSGALGEFNTFYNPSWGRLKAITAPVPGNHEYKTAGAAGYFAYFGDAARTNAHSYYSFDLGGWHLVALNSNCTFVSCAAGSAQETWLRSDLAAHSDQCTLAYWHHPDLPPGSAMSAFWVDLYAAHADLILTGHVHNYQRFRPLDADGASDSGRGIREFIVGTGGKDTSSGTSSSAEASYNQGFGVLKLILRPTGYSWQFVPEPRSTFQDSGGADCHNRPDGAPPTGVRVKVARRVQSSKSFSVSWTASDSGSGVASYDVRYRTAAWNGEFGPRIAWQRATTVLRRSFVGAPGSTYCFSVRARDRRGNVSWWSSETCTAIPLDDLKLRGTGWSRQRAAGYFLDTYSLAQAHGRTLHRTGVSARRITLVATTCPSCGSVVVLWNGHVLKRIDLRSTAVEKNRLLPVVLLRAVRNGSVTIRISSRGRPVKIEGLGLARR
jgi:acid phosphatase type 7